MIAPVAAFWVGVFAPAGCRPDPVSSAAPLSPAAQWAAVAGTVRVSAGPLGSAVATAAVVGVRPERGEAYLLTAGHAVPAAEGRLYEFFTKASYPAPAFKVVGGDIVVRLDGCDVALVKVAVGGDLPGVVRMAPRFDRPKRFPAAATAVGCPNGVPPRCRPETVEGKTLIKRPPDYAAFFWQTVAAPAGGMSGGPLLDGQGRVIGVCTAAQGGHGFYAHLDEIQAGLRKESYRWLTDDGPPP